MSSASPPKTALLFVQLGSPDAPTPAAVRRYLAEFLADRRVVDMHRAIWLPLLHGVILRRRPQRSAALYQHIWREDGHSPLLHYSRQQSQAVALALQADSIAVHLAMRYGNPALAVMLHALLDAGVERLLVFPLFPQYSAATTASILDGVQKALARRRFVPTLRFAQPFFAHPAYLEAWAEQIRSMALLEQVDCVLFSFHGLPQRHVDEGDPYGTQCQQTARLLAERLNLPEERWRLSFQSRFGREPWLNPSTEQMLAELPAQGKKRLLVVCPGFVSDCLETLEEIGMQGRARFLAAGGTDFHRAPCLNESAPWLTALTRMARQELLGWL
ncbi:MAG: ferrochelatase [Magnetococcales bacterium]|nr:ferrochelatase [Magnetococcales bacterium]